MACIDYLFHNGFELLSNGFILRATGETHQSITDRENISVKLGEESNTSTLPYFYTSTASNYKDLHLWGDTVCVWRTTFAWNSRAVAQDGLSQEYWDWKPFVRWYVENLNFSAYEAGVQLIII